MHCVILRYDEISVQFRLFVPIFMELQPSFGILFQIIFSAADGLLWEVLSQNTPEKSPSGMAYSKQKVFDSVWQEIQNVSVANTAFWIILDHVSDAAICHYFQLWPMFSLVSDRLEGQVSEQKDAETLDMVKMAKKYFFRKIANTVFCIVADA